MRTAALTLTSVLVLGLAACSGPAQPAKETAAEATPAAPDCPREPSE